MLIRLGLGVAVGTPAVWAVVLLLRWFGPIDYSHTGMEALPVISIFLVGVWVAVVYWMLAPRRRSVGNLSASSGSRRRRVPRAQVALMVAFSIVYLIAILMDKSQALLVGPTTLRYQEIAAGGTATLTGALHQYFAGAPVLLAMMLVSRRTSLDSQLVRPLLWVLVAICFASYFLTGGRNAFFIGAAMISVGTVMQRRLAAEHAHKPKGKQNRSLTQRLALIAGFVLGFVYSMYLFVERAAVRNTDLAGSIHILDTEYGASVRGMDLPPIIQVVYDAFSLFVFYLTHQIGYVAEYLRNDIEPMAMGGYSFHLYARTIDVIAGTHLAQEAFDSLIVPGVYLSLPGSFYVDFGMVGVFFAGAVPTALLLIYSRRIMAGGRFSDLVFSAYFGTLLLLSPIYSITGIALGPSLLFVALLQRASETLLPARSVLPGFGASRRLPALSKRGSA